MLDLISKTGDLLRAGSISPVELTRQCLDNIEKLNPVLNAFITVTTESALLQAAVAEAEIRGGRWRGPLHGIPLGLKDLIDTAGIRTTAASALFQDRIPAEDAEVVRRLKTAGAVLLGKQNLHEFAYGGSSLVSHFGDVKNAWNPDRIAGGSSGGSATSIAAGMCYGAIATDTAGSIREPAALCGVVGLKPTYGAVSLQGVIPLSPSLDNAGPMARTVADCAALFQAIAADDERNGPGGGRAAISFSRSLEQIPQRLRLGVLRTFFCEGLDAEIASAFEQALSLLSTLVSEVREVEVLVPTDRSLQSAESYACHAEFVRRNPELYQPETLRRLRAGESVSSEDLLARRRELEQARREIDRIFEDVDLLVSPTTPIPAPAIAELTLNPALLRPRELLLLRNTRPFNVWGLPAISVPCGFTQSGLPIGLQIAGPNSGEAAVLRLAHSYEQATAWHKRQPPRMGAC